MVSACARVFSDFCEEVGRRRKTISAMLQIDSRTQGFLQVFAFYNVDLNCALLNGKMKNHRQFSFISGIGTYTVLRFSFINGSISFD